MGNETPAARLAAFLRDHEREIVTDWEEAAQRIAADRAARPALTEHVSPLLERIAAIADALAVGPAADLPESAAERLAIERLDECCDLRDVVAELALLRDSVLQVLERERTALGASTELRIVNHAIDRAIAAAIRRFVAARDRTLQALDRIASAELEAASAEQLCRRLLAVLLEVTPSLDTAAILLLDGDLLRVAATVGLEEHAHSGFAVPIRDGFAGEVARHRQPLELHSAETDPLVRNPVMRARKVRALYGVPLIEGGRLLGVAHMGSLTRYEFSAGEKHLFRSFAARAAAGIFQHTLRELADRRAIALAETEARYRAAFDNAAVGIAQVALDGRFLEVNRKYADILGYAPEELRGRRFVDVTHPDDVEDELRNARVLEIPNGATLWREKRYLCKDGRVTWVAVAVATVRGARGNPEYNIAVIEDISARKAIEQELERSRAGLEAALAKAQAATRMREEILALVSHDLRSPLSAIHLAAQNLAGRIGSEGDEKVRRQFMAITRSAGRMERLISDLLDVASIEAGRLSVDRRPQPAAALVHDAVEQHRELATDRRIALTALCNDEGVNTLCDRERIVQVFGNLVGNALKFCGEGAQVQVRCTVRPRDVEFEVADTGPGIPEHQLAHVFEPYWTTRRSAGAGTGLGLYISKAIIDAHHGQIWADSRTGAGTTVHFTLPRTPQ